MIEAFALAAGVSAIKLSVALRLVLSFLACVWGGWIILGIVRHMRGDVGSGESDELFIFSRLLRLSLVVMVLLMIAYEPYTMGDNNG